MRRLALPCALRPPASPGTYGRSRRIGGVLARRSLRTAGGVGERPWGNSLTAALPDDRAPALDGLSAAGLDGLSAAGLDGLTAAGPEGRWAAGLDRADRRRRWRKEGAAGGSAAPAARSRGLPRAAAEEAGMALASQAFCVQS